MSELTLTRFTLSAATWTPILVEEPGTILPSINGIDMYVGDTLDADNSAPLPAEGIAFSQAVSLWAKDRPSNQPGHTILGVLK